jgi:hypothetical protein
VKLACCLMNLCAMAAFVTLTTAWGQGTDAPVPLSQQTVPGVGGNWTDVSDGVFNVAFRLPPQWLIRSAGRWRDGSDPATTVTFSAPASDGDVSLYYRLWQPPVGPDKAEIDRYLASRVDSKVSQRVREGFTGYQIRAGSYEARQVGGYRALSVVADYRNGLQPMVEYVTWVYGPTSVAFFFARTQADNLPDVRDGIEPLMQSLRLP